MNQKKLALTLGFLLACAVAAQSHAAGEARMKEKVSFEDLNLDSPSGAKVLLSRLKGAARDVCQPLAGFGVEGQGRWQACFDRAMADAVAVIDKPAVTATFRADHAAGVTG